MRYLLGSTYATPSLAELSEWTGSLSKQRPFDLLRSAVRVRYMSESRYSCAGRKLQVG